MSTFEAIDFEEAARRTGLSVEYISGLKSDGKILVLTGGDDSKLMSVDCAMIGIRAAAKKAGLSESTMRNLADSKEIYCEKNPRNNYRSIWITDAKKLKTRIRE
jgi:hypothetical protein